MPLHYHSSIKIAIEMPDFDCLQRHSQTRLSHLLRRAPPIAGCAATSNPLRWLSIMLPAAECLLQKGRSSLCCARCASSRTQGRVQDVQRPRISCDGCCECLLQPNACCRKAGGHSAVPAARPAARRADSGRVQAVQRPRIRCNGCH